MLMLRRRPSLNALRTSVWGAIGAVLLAPLVAMQFTNQVVWTTSDFAAATVMLLVIGLAFEVISSRRKLHLGVKSALLILVVGLVALVWPQGAVGLRRAPAPRLVSTSSRTLSHALMTTPRRNVRTCRGYDSPPADVKPRLNRRPRHRP